MLRMHKLVTAMVAALIGVLLASQVQAQDYSPAAKQVLANARAAAGGSRWNAVRGWRESGTRDGMAYDHWVDPLRYGVRLETREAAGLRVQGFNGAGVWQITPQGQVSGVEDRLSLARARTDAFLAAYGFFFPSRYAARGEYLGVRQSAGRSFDVVTVQPLGGLSQELWFDRRTRLLGRIVDRSGGRAVTTELSDHRKAGAITLPYRQSLESGDGPAKVRQARTITIGAADRALFSLARTGPPPIAAPPPQTTPRQAPRARPPR
jgi:hypothetical protein